MDELEERIVTFDIPSESAVPEEYRDGSVEIAIPRSRWPSIVDTEDGRAEFEKWTIEVIRHGEDAVRWHRAALQVISRGGRVLLDTLREPEERFDIVGRANLSDEEIQELVDSGVSGDHLGICKLLGVTLAQLNEENEEDRSRAEEIAERKKSYWDAVARGQNPFDIIDDSDVYTPRPDRLTDAVIDELVDILKMQGVVFNPGLTDDEVAAVEARYGFVFPPDLRRLLQRALPISDRFYNWRVDSPTIRQALETPVEGLLFDFQYNGFWLPEW